VTLVASRQRSVHDALIRCAKFLANAGIESARLESELLTAHALGIPRHRLLVIRDAPLPKEAARRLVSWVRRRRRREPIAYLLGEREFFSLPFAVNDSVLVPRPETEHLVEEGLTFARSRTRGLRVLDVGTGSGAVAVAFAVNCPAAKVVALDKSAAALLVARANAARHAVAERIEFVRGDLKDLASSFRPGSFDLVLANPPYVAADHVRDELAHEPHGALVSDCGAFPAVYRRLASAAILVAKGGAMAVEVGIGQADVVAAIFRETGLFQRVRWVDDLAGVPRVIVAECAGDPLDLARRVLR
jgi:release factor glutamine methyltransferase